MILSREQYRKFLERSPFLTLKIQHTLNENAIDQKKATKEDSNATLASRLRINTIQIDGVTMQEIELQYPDLITIDPSQLTQLFNELTGPTMDLNDLLTICPDIQQLILFLDYFQFNLWPQFFQQFIQYDSFRKEN